MRSLQSSLLSSLSFGGGFKYIRKENMHWHSFEVNTPGAMVHVATTLVCQPPVLGRPWTCVLPSTLETWNMGQWQHKKSVSRRVQCPFKTPLDLFWSTQGLTAQTSSLFSKDSSLHLFCSSRGVMKLYLKRRPSAPFPWLNKLFRSCHFRSQKSSSNLQYKFIHDQHVAIWSWANTVLHLKEFFPLLSVYHLTYLLRDITSPLTFVWPG